MGADDRTEELRRLKKEALQSGGPERIAARRKKGTGTARERVLRLLDPDSFVELDVFVEGVVTGHGKIAGRDVYVFSEDGQVPRGALGDEFAEKIVKVMDLATKNGAPLVGLYDSGATWGWKGGGAGAAAGDSDGATGLGGYAGIFFRNVMASGVVPQISAIMGACGGATVYSPALTDLVIMVKGGSHAFLGDPRAAASGSDDELGLEEIGGARTHSEMSGFAQLAAEDEAECLDMIAELLSYLPQNNLEDTPLSSRNDPVDRRDEALESLALRDSSGPHDMRQVIAHVVDDGALVELMPRWATNLIVGFARLGGRAVGIVGNQPTHLDGRLDQDGAAKGARFVRFCDAFNLPLVTFVDTPGFLSGEGSGHGRTLREAAKLMYAFCEATVPKLTVVTHRAYGEGFEVMCSKQIGADFNFAWPSAEIAAVAPDSALDRQDITSPYEAAVSGHLDDIIEPVETRPRLIAALEACASKRDSRPAKKHGNIPL
jgi:propionyl-CoA/long-chain acyl-CoA carboxylase carboxyl transferase subunit